MLYTVLPSLPAENWEQLETLLRTLRGVTQEFQVDLVDGEFAPNRSWPFAAPDIHQELKRLEQFCLDFEIEYDCMVEEPLQYFDSLRSLGAKRLIAHYGSVSDWQGIHDHHRRYGYQLGLAFTNDVPLLDITALLPQFDFVQVMGIASVGAQGQPFDERTLETVTTLRASYPELEIAIDGAVNEKTIPRLKQAGANRFAPGSAISRSPEPAVAYKHLLTIMQAA